MYPRSLRGFPEGKSLYKPSNQWVFMGYNPQESLEKTINTMGTLLGIHPIVPWGFGLGKYSNGFPGFLFILVVGYMFCSSNTGWWFQIVFIFAPIWGRFPFWQIFFKGVETRIWFLVFLGIMGCTCFFRHDSGKKHVRARGVQFWM